MSNDNTEEKPSFRDLRAMFENKAKSSSLSSSNCLDSNNSVAGNIRRRTTKELTSEIREQTPPPPPPLPPPPPPTPFVEESKEDQPNQEKCLSQTFFHNTIGNLLWYCCLTLSELVRKCVSALWKTPTTSSTKNDEEKSNFSPPEVTIAEQLENNEQQISLPTSTTTTTSAPSIVQQFILHDKDTLMQQVDAKETIKINSKISTAFLPTRNEITNEEASTMIPNKTTEMETAFAKPSVRSISSRLNIPMPGIVPIRNRPVVVEPFNNSSASGKRHVAFAKPSDDDDAVGNNENGASFDQPIDTSNCLSTPLYQRSQMALPQRKKTVNLKHICASDNDLEDEEKL